MTLTPAQRTVLARMSDSEWYRGYDMHTSAVVLGALYRKDLIRAADDGRYGFLADN